MKRLLPLLPLLLLLACKPAPVGPPGTGSPGIIDCTSQAVQKQWPRVLPAVNQCLVMAAEANWVGCLIGLIDPVAGVTESTIACLTSTSGARFRDAAEHNPNDGASARAAARAEEFVAKRGYRFAP